ncbi:hypothetical protein NHQ30_010153 [Ciborinia camelliae]|nr:hypothetical protein NHQ30_010153 [Ciborinia camelliae]
MSLQIPLQSVTSTSCSSPSPQVKVRPKRWKEIGYPIYAEFTASDSELFIIRRFNNLNARVILGLQDEICVMEEKLHAIDRRCKEGNEDIWNGSFRGDTQQDRKILLQNIKERLKEYKKFVGLHASLKTRPPVKPAQIENIKNWHRKNEGAIYKEELKYLDTDEDLMTIVPINKTPLRRALEHFEWFKTVNYFRRHPTKTKASYDAGTIFYHSDDKIQTFDSGIVILLGVIMLLIPLWILEAMQSKKAILGVISVFVVGFMLLVQVVTLAKPYETLAAAAA